MTLRRIIEIDREKCNGCGLCTKACAEGALALDAQNKAVLVKAIYCDGMGACLDVCPTGALKIVIKDTAGYDPEETHRHVLKTRLSQKVASELRQWPIQLHLVSPQAPYFEDCDLLVAADCTAFALGSFHGELLKGKKLVIACPKLDDTDGYLEKLTELIKQNHLKSVTVAIMEVPCCMGLLRTVGEAMKLAGASLEIKKIVVGIEGDVR